jgi:hypothetical protein
VKPTSADNNTTTTTTTTAAAVTTTTTRTAKTRLRQCNPNEFNYARATKHTILTNISYAHVFKKSCTALSSSVVVWVATMSAIRTACHVSFKSSLIGIGYVSDEK